MRRTNQAGMLRRRPWKRAGHVGLDETPGPATPATPDNAAGVEAKLDLSTMLAALSVEHRQVIVLREGKVVSIRDYGRRGEAYAAAGLGPS